MVSTVNGKLLSLGVMCIIHAQEKYLVSKYKGSFSYRDIQGRGKNIKEALVFLKYHAE